MWLTPLPDKALAAFGVARNVKKNVFRIELSAQTPMDGSLTDPISRLVARTAHRALARGKRNISGSGSGNAGDSGSSSGSWYIAAIAATAAIASSV